MRAPEIRTEFRILIDQAIKNRIIRAILRPYIEKILKALIKWLTDKGLINSSGESTF